MPRGKTADGESLSRRDLHLLFDLFGLRLSFLQGQTSRCAGAFVADVGEPRVMQDGAPFVGELLEFRRHRLNRRNAPRL